MPDLRQLRTFVAVAEELNFTRAAQRLYLAQQTVSKTVHQLERELGVELLERTTREVRLTPAGTALLDDGRRALAAVDASFHHAREIGRGLAGTVTIGATPAIAPAERERIAHVLRAGAQHLAVSFREVRPHEILPQLRDQILDLVLARTAVDGVATASLPPTPAVLCVPTAHRLAATRSVSATQLDGARLLTWNPSGTPFTDLLVTRLASAGAAVTPVQARVTGGVLASELADTETVALLPTGWPPTDGITQLTLENELPLPLLALWPAGTHSPTVERIRAHTQ